MTKTGLSGPIEGGISPRPSRAARASCSSSLPVLPTSVEGGKGRPQQPAASPAHDRRGLRSLAATSRCQPYPLLLQSPVTAGQHTHTHTADGTDPAVKLVRSHTRVGTMGFSACSHGPMVTRPEMRPAMALHWRCLPAPRVLDLY